MAGILKGQAGSPIEFEVKPTVGAEPLATEAAISAPNSALVKGALNATGDAPIYACRAWVNFNGTGTVAIRASGNVSSITDNGAGSYTVNFATAMPDANYQVCTDTSHTTGIDTPYRSLVESDVVFSVNSVAVITLAGNSRSDRPYVFAAIFR